MSPLRANNYINNPDYVQDSPLKKRINIDESVLNESTMKHKPVGISMPMGDGEKSDDNCSIENDNLVNNNGNNYLSKTEFQIQNLSKTETNHH